jgi:hypothetical protein
MALNAQISTTEKSLKWPRSYVKNNMTINVGLGNYQPEAIQLSSFHNYAGLQGDYQGSMSNLIVIGYDLHERDNYMVGVSYSYFSAKSGTWIDNNNGDLNYFKVSMHQLTAKYNYGWYNNYDFGGVLYSGFSISARVINKEVVYPEAIMVFNQAKFPYDYSTFAAHLTLIGIKGRFTKDGKLGIYSELGVGNMGIINYGLNYTF